MYKIYVTDYKLCKRQLINGYKDKREVKTKGVKDIKSFVEKKGYATNSTSWDFAIFKQDNNKEVECGNKEILILLSTNSPF